MTSSQCSSLNNDDADVEDRVGRRRWFCDATAAAEAAADDSNIVDLELTDYEKSIVAKYLLDYGDDDDAAPEDNVGGGEEEEENASRRRLASPAQTIRAESPTVAVVLDRFPVEPNREWQSADRFPCRQTVGAFFTATVVASSTSLPPPSSSTNAAACATAIAAPSAAAAAVGAVPSVHSHVDVASVVGVGVGGGGVSSMSGRAKPTAANNRNTLRKSLSFWVGVTSCVCSLLLYLDRS